MFCMHLSFYLSFFYFFVFLMDWLDFMRNKTNFFMPRKGTNLCLTED